MRPQSNIALAASLTALFVSFGMLSAQAEWPQFMGPTRDGVSSETGLARAWPEAGPKTLWSCPVGEGYGAPVVRDGEVYILDRVDNKQDVLRCLAFDTGKELWSFAYDAPGEVSHNGSRTAPTVDDKYVYSVGVFGHFYCIDRKTHQPVWNKNLLSDFGVEMPGWGVVQAPSLYKDFVIVAPQADDAYVVAFKKDTGEIAWKSVTLGRVGYSVPVVAKLAGVDQVLMIGACTKGGGTMGKIAGFSADSGKLLWGYTGWQCFIPIPYPTVLPDDRVFITGGYKSGSAMIQVKPEGDGFAVKELFKTVEGSQIPQALYCKDHLFLNANTNDREDGLVCLGLDGQVKWKTKDGFTLPRFDRGSLILADNMIINFDGKTGALHLIDPNPAEYKELARAQIFKGKEMWAPLALSGGRLLVRNQQEMKCLDLKNP